MSKGPVHDRIARARRILEANGLLDARVEAEGPEREIAAIRVSPADWARLQGEEGGRIAGEVREAGFRYVALDLRPDGGDGPAEGERETPGEE